jgi:sugar lactone lactonase YvrE
MSDERRSTASPIRTVLQSRARLGEGPLWDEETGTLFWVDIFNHRVNRFDPVSGRHREYEVGDVVGAMAFGPSHSLIVALRHDLALLDLLTGELEHLAEVETERQGCRLNDGKCDSRGRFWIGSMSGEEGEGALYRFDPDGTLRRMEEGLTISNGLGWSPDDRTFYLTDSPEKRIYAYDFDAESGEISGRRVWVELDGEPVPDGLAVDEEGCVWSAQWDGGCVIRFAPDGSEIARVEVPVPRPTSCIFGGRDRRDLYITSASIGMSEEEIDESPASGDLFCVRAAVAGLPVHRFGGEPWGLRERSG